MELYDEFFRIVQKLNESKVAYAVVGGVAYSFYVEPRYTKDIDFLIDPGEVGRVVEVLSGLGYFESSAPWTFKASQIELHRFMKTEGEEFMIIDVMMGKDKRYEEILTNAKGLETGVGMVNLASRKDLIWLKSLRGSSQDQVDIEALQNDKT